MKQILLASLMASAIAAPCAFAGCNGENGGISKDKTSNAHPKTLVTYFSASGVTQGVAQTLAKAIGADLFEITPTEKYSNADLDWTNKKSRSTLEMKDAKSRVAIAGKVDNMSQYDTIFIGFPIWWGTAPHIIESFLESYNLEGKVIVPFATSGGSPMGNTVNDLKPSAPKATWLAGKMLNGQQSEEKLSQWVATLR